MRRRLVVRVRGWVKRKWESRAWCTVSTTSRGYSELKVDGRAVGGTSTSVGAVVHAIYRHRARQRPTRSPLTLHLIACASFLRLVAEQLQYLPTDRLHLLICRVRLPHCLHCLDDLQCGGQLSGVAVVVQQSAEDDEKAIGQLRR